MGLYLCVFDNNGEEIEGVDVGSYADFNSFRDAVKNHVENGIEGSLCPTLMLHSDCSGLWSPADSAQLQKELDLITEKLRGAPAQTHDVAWKVEVIRRFGLHPKNLYDCFFDVDGEPLIERIRSLTEVSTSQGLPILFQ